MRTAAPSAREVDARLLRCLTSVFSSHSDLKSVILFGSRAMGTHSPRSDIDLATTGLLSRHALGRLKLDLDELDIPQRCDVVALEKIRHEPLLRHIEAVGVTIYRLADKGTPETGRP